MTHDASRTEQQTDPLKVYEELERATPEQKAGIVFRLINAHPRRRLELPARDGVRANLRGMDFSADTNRDRGFEIEMDELDNPPWRSARKITGQASLSFANLEGADLSQANLKGTNLHSSNLKSAILDEANLERARLMFAVLQRASLQRANLHRTDFEKADLEGANLTGASFLDADLKDTNLRGTQGADFQSGRLNGTLLPDGTVSNFSGQPVPPQSRLGDASVPVEGVSVTKASTTARLDVLTREPAASDIVPTHTDSPAQVDQLGRVAFAKALAMRLRRLQSDQRASSFMLHIHGPWGSGKSSLLHFLSEELKKEPEPWIVISFNAWQHQRTGSPWWWLMNSLFRQATRQMWMTDRRRALTIWIREYMWRSRSSGWTPYLMAMSSLLMLTVLFWVLGPTAIFRVFGTSVEADKPRIITLGDTAKAVSAIIAFIVTILGFLFGLSRSLVPGSARSVRTFVESTRDPMQALTQHFNKLVGWIGRPVAILVDDLDRCQGSYVIELLEGIQTLFREVPVTYVVAADRRWVCSSYEKAYADYAGSMGESGRTLGYLFLEKIFQLSTSVPRMSSANQSEYWQHLIGIDQAAHEEAKRRAHAEARQEFQDYEDETQVLAATQRSTGNPILDQARREEAVVRLAAPEVEASTEHTLRVFAGLLEPNPRAMKRMVNAYGTLRAIDTLKDEDSIEPGLLALWTIATLRWPVLAEYLENRPELVTYIAAQEPLPQDADVPESLRRLVLDEDVRRVITGEGVGTSLDADAIRACASLRSSGSSSSTVA